MINIQENIELQTINTFGLPGRARYFAELNDAAELPALCDSEIFAKHPVLWLGGGSNILLRGDYPGLVVKINNKGIREIRRSDGLVLLEAQAGEIWHDFVCHTVALGLNGLENLSLIPGTVGAAPVQNIGAYGVEVKDLIDTVKCFDLAERRFVEFSNAECRFAYRDSLFKQEGKGRYVICAVVFKLSTNFILKAAYGDLAAVLAPKRGTSLGQPYWPNNAADGSRLPAVFPKPSAPSAAANCPTLKFKAMSAASSKTPWFPHTVPPNCSPPIQPCRTIPRQTERSNSPPDG